MDADDTSVPPPNSKASDPAALASGMKAKEQRYAGFAAPPGSACSSP
jgi:hypothetical protein